LIDRSKSVIAGEGIPVLLALGAIAAIVWRFAGAWHAVPVLAVLAFALLLFRDPRRGVAMVALGVVSPVDGRIQKISGAADDAPGQGVQRIVIRVNPFGTYTARAPVEGKVMDPNAAHEPGERTPAPGGLWLHTDEGADVVLRFRGSRFGLVPAAIVRYGSRVGQGQRCAFLRWTRFAELELPETARILVGERDRVKAGRDVLAELPHP
jgi:phosphatidylserine decarboxylase